MKIKIKSNFLLVITIFFTLITDLHAAGFVSKNTFKIKNNETITVSEKTFSRINGYLNGSFYSENLNKKLKNISGIYLAISRDGNNSTISFCDADNFDLCAEQMLGYQTLKKCEKIANQKCFFVFRGKVFLPTKNEKIDNKKFFLIKSDSNGHHIDIYGKTVEEFNLPDK